MEKVAGYLSINNWHKYQARTDKDLPWLKLWGKLFTNPWWQELEDKYKIIPIIFLDAARRFNNKTPVEASYYLRNYNLSLSEKDFLAVCNLLKMQDFLSDLPVGLSSDCSSLILSKDFDFGLKDRVTGKKTFKKPSFEELTEAMKAGGLEAASASVEAQKFLNHYITVGWVCGKALKPMKSWRGAVATWLQNYREWGASPASDGLTKAQKITLKGLEEFNASRNPKQGDHAPRRIISGDHV